jgi:hypothetical protein
VQFWVAGYWFEMLSGNTISETLPEQITHIMLGDAVWKLSQQS